ncbi:hypothetical protein V5E97_32990 [Singulisphaera sp. Ch08]|uniref:Lipoprotein n=1 Tax=Singulisphaera sp. Ch08 TaxID=3120278 RepID=A0AAU7CD63_9BACT
MRRVLAMLATMALLMIGGCGSKSYELRLDETLENIKYQDRLNKLLMPALTKGKWEELSIYLRPPKNLAQTKAWMLVETEPGKFDQEASFDEPKKQSMHVLARVKRAKTPGKKAAPSPADTVDRTNFNGDVLAILNEFYKPPEELTITKFKTETKKKNDFKFHSMTVNDKSVKIYLYKKDPYDVALIFEYPKSEEADLYSKIGLSLESFAVGDRARRFFGGATSEAEASGDAAPSGVAF